MALIRFTFQETERLKREQDIQTLFQTGKAFSAFSLKCIWLKKTREAGASAARIVIAVPKKRIPKATGRNRIKRQIREYWRLNKHQLYGHIPADVQLHLFLILKNTTKYTRKDIELSVLKMISTLSQEMATL